MKVGVIGLGYVGLPLAVAFALRDIDVLGIDHDERKLALLAAGNSYVDDVSDEELHRVQPRLTTTSEFAPLAEADAVIICAPTPLSGNREPDLGPLLDCVVKLGAVLRAGQLVAIESTTYPGTTREQVAPLLAARSGLRPGVDFHLVFSPERVDPGRTDFTLANTPKVVGGLTEACVERASRSLRRRLRSRSCASRHQTRRR